MFLFVKFYIFGQPNKKTFVCLFRKYSFWLSSVTDNFHFSRRGKKTTDA